MDENSGSSGPRCSKHDRLIEYFCKDDQEAICSRCYIMGDHKGHAIESFEEKNKSIIASLENGMETATIVYNKLLKVDKIFVTNKLKSEKSKLVENVVETFVYMQNALKQRESDILKEVDKIYDIHVSLANSMVENAKNDSQKLEKALSDSISLHENQGLIVDGDNLLTIINSAPNIPCILSELSTNTTWDKTHVADIVDAINSFGTIKGNDVDKELAPIRLETVTEAPEAVEDKDKIFRTPLMSQKSCDSYSVSSIDTGEDVIIESDTDSIATTVSLSSVSSRGSIGKEVIMPQVKGQCKQISVTHIRSPNDFYIQLLANKISLEKLSRTMNAWCRKKSSAQHVPSILERGMLVMGCYSEDKQWYRARVLDVNVTGDGGMKAHVIYYDFGNEEKLPMKSLRKMEPRFSRYPPFCCHCSLYDIAPLHNQSDWDCHSIQEFLRLTNNQVLLLNVIATKGLTYEVDLICLPTADVLDDQFSSVRDMLIFLDLAKFATPSQLGNDGKSASYKTYNFFKPTALASGDMVEMTVSEALSPSDFYIMPNGDEKLYYLNMMEEMNEVYDNDGPGLYTMYCPRKDCVCAVKGPDNKWHRGKIVTNHKPSKVTVFLVDRGSTLVVHYDKIKRLLCDFIKLPSQAVCCTLADVGLADLTLGDWSEEAKVWCRADLKGSQGTVRIVRWGEQTEVVLWMGSNTSGQSVNSLLVEAGLATSIGLSSMPVMMGQNQEMKNSRGKKESTQHTGSQEPPEPLSPRSSSSSSIHTVTNSPSKSPHSSPSKKQAGPLYTHPAAAHSKTTKQLLNTKLSSETHSAPVSARSSPSLPSAGTALNKSKSQSTLSVKTSTQTSSASIHTTKSNREKKFKKHGRRSRGDQEEEMEDVKGESGDNFASAEETERKKKVQENIHKAMGEVAAKQDSGDSKNDGDSIYIEILVVCYKSPTNFFIRIQEQETALRDLMQELNQEYSNQEIVPDLRWNLGDFCVVRSPSDQQWYRAKIMAVTSATDVEVELLDYGHHFQVLSDELRPLLLELGSRLRRAAVRCHLANLIPTGSSDRSKWTRTATEFMENIVRSKKLYIKTEDDPCESGLPIDIIVEEEIPETAFEPVTFTYHSMRQKMVDEGLAMFDKPRKRAPTPVSPSSESKLSAEETYYVQPPAPSVVELPAYDIPDLNASLEVIPTFVDFGGVIYAQQVDWDSKVGHLSEELQRVYQDSPKCHRVWALGDVCVAPFVDDGLWYRGLIEEMDSDKAKIFYVDFGNSAWMSCDQLLEIRGSFADYHVQVYHCVLEDLMPNTTDGKWPTPVLDVVHDLVVNCQCSMVYKGMMDNGHLKIKLRKSDGFDLSTYLIDNGFAVSMADLEDRYAHSKTVGNILTGSGLCSNPDLGCVGTVFQAVATEVELPNVVYVQRTRVEEADVHDFVRASEIAAINNEIDQFEEMMKAIKETPSSGFIKLPDVGMLCLAKYHFDNSWYRALCLEQVPEMDSNLVIFIDYGTSEIVSKDCLRALPSQFWDLPSQGIRCYLNLTPPGGPSSVWRKNSLDAMVTSLNQKTLTVKVVQMSPLMVDLFVESESGELNLAYEEMIQKGLAWLPMQINADVLIGGDRMKRELDDVEVEEVVEDESGYVGSEVVVADGEDGRVRGRPDSQNNSYCAENEDVVIEPCDPDVKVEHAGTVDEGEGGIPLNEEEDGDEVGGGYAHGEDVESCSGDLEEGWATASDEDSGSAV